MRKFIYFLPIVFLLSHSCYSMQLIREGTDFSVKDNGVTHKIKRCYLPKFLRNLDEEHLKRYEECGNRYRIAKLDKENYTIHEQGGLKGGGPVGATILAIGGFTAVGLASLGTLIVTLPSGPGALAAAAAVATAGTAAVTAGVIAAAVVPTP